MVSSFLSTPMPPERPWLGTPARQERLRALMESRRISYLLVTNPLHLRYLTGFSGSAGVALFNPYEGILWVDPRYTLQAREQAQGVEVREEKKGLLRGVAAWLGKAPPREVAYEEASLTCAEFQRLRQEAGRRVRFRPGKELIEELRVVKDSGEIELIRTAGHITAEVFTDLFARIKPGVRECDLAAEIDYCMRKRGAARAAFETIVVSGPRSAYPHARSSPKRLEEREWVILDFGAIFNGYAADMTRTVYLGEPSRRVRGLYASVLKAQGAAVRSVQAGIKAGEVDATARRVLAQRGLARFFTHSAGHGVGLEIHEKPRLAKGEQGRLRAGSVVTVEPGVYVEGQGGVRVEDTVLVAAEGSETLTPAATERWIVS